jgi:hypothetical protein
LGSIVYWVASSSGIFGMLGRSDAITKFGISRGEARINFKVEDSLDEEEEDDTTDATSSIEQATTRSSSDPYVGWGATTLRVEAGVEDVALLTFACFFACTDDGSTLIGLFIPVLILSTPPFNVAGTTTVFCAPAFGAIFADQDKVAPTPFGVVGTFGAAVFLLPGTFVRIPTGLALTSCFLFLVASVLS